ncbi:unnamed protein product, partial [Hapterophycus canaliculatus]
RGRHSYGKSRPKKQKEVLYFDGEVVKKAAPVARRWENIEYDEASMPKPSAVIEAAEGAVDDEADGAEEAPPAVSDSAEEAEPAASDAAVEAE